MELRHYSDEEFVFAHREYEQPELREFGKPNGFWVSVLGEDDWHWWCTQENFHPNRLTLAYEVRLRAGAKICYLRTPDELDQFHEEYCSDNGVHMPSIHGMKHFWPIDWGKVAAEFDGIIIAPYLWSRRFDGPSWYYGWDCASGCVWNCEAIESVELIIPAPGI